MKKIYLNVPYMFVKDYEKGFERVKKGRVCLFDGVKIVRLCCTIVFMLWIENLICYFYIFIPNSEIENNFCNFCFFQDKSKDSKANPLSVKNIGK